MIRINRFPENDAANGWSNILAPRVPNAPLRGEISADWLVIGAGYAGLAAARRLAENRPDDSVAIVDACAVGDGASARNSGFVIDLPHNVGGDGDDHEGPFRALRLARAASNWLGEIVKTHQIDCQWSPVGQYMAASSDGGRSLRRTHLIATFRPVARCVPRHTVAKEPDFSCRLKRVIHQNPSEVKSLTYTQSTKHNMHLLWRSADRLLEKLFLCSLPEILETPAAQRTFVQQLQQVQKPASPPGILFEEEREDLCPHEAWPPSRCPPRNSPHPESRLRGT